MLILLALAGQNHIKAVGGPLLLLLIIIIIIILIIIIIIIIRQTELINLGSHFHDGTGDRFDCRSLPAVLSIVIAIPSMAFSNMDTLEALEP
jgi:preprotein translocase subunit SecG